MRSIPIPSSNLNTPSSNTLAPTTNTIVTTSPWHSPVPYLFGGLSIIMALIAVALFMLACSYWRLTRTQQSDLENNNNNNVVKEGDDDDTQNKEETKVYEEKILVIMAGDHKPTFLATPSSSLVIGNLNFHKHIGNSEDCDDDDENKSHKEIMHKQDDDDDDVVVVVDATHENGSSQHEQHRNE